MGLDEGEAQERYKGERNPVPIRTRRLWSKEGVFGIRVA